MDGFIYIIRNSVNGKIYIGQTRTTIDQRWHEHLRHAEYGNCVINRAMRKYGVDKFSIEILETCDREILDEREMYYIDKYNSTDSNIGYNVSIGGTTPRFKQKELPQQDIVDMYTKQGNTLQQIAKKYDVTRYIITNVLKLNGALIKDRHEQCKKFSKIAKSDILKALEGRSVRAAARFLNVPYTTFRKACIYNNIEYNSSTSAQHESENIC